MLYLLFLELIIFFYFSISTSIPDHCFLQKKKIKKDFCFPHNYKNMTFIQEKISQIHFPVGELIESLAQQEAEAKISSAFDI